ncbi:hypothetical protein KR018_008733 [Drosophila ironensis]|nr:hypothetical protein KR018_008733 [Drosophila ironensis]
MAALDPSTTLLPNDSDDLQEARDVELRNVLRMKLVLQELRRLKLGPNKSPEIREALKRISIGEFVRLGEGPGQDNLLDFPDFSGLPALSYTDRKAVRSQLSVQLKANLQPLADMGDKIRQEFPDAFASHSGGLSADQREILKLEQEHRASVEQLVELLARKGELLQEAVELKLGSQLANELKLQQAQAQLVQTKVELLRGCFVHHAATRTDHSVKAHKVVEAHLDELLSAKNPSKN